MSLLRQCLILLVVLGVAAGGYRAYESLSAPADAGPAPAQNAGRDRRDRTVAVEVAPVAALRLERTVEAVGTTRAARSVEIVPQAKGWLVAFPAEPGIQVAAGTVLARLDDDIERADLAEAEARAREAANALDRARTLRRNNNVSEATLEQLQAQNSIADAIVRRARRRLADRAVTAPFDGVVGLSRVDVGARVEESTVLTTLDDLSSAEIEFAVPELLYGRVAPGQRVVADGAAFPGRRFEGTVTAIDSRIDLASRAFKVRAALPNPDRTLPAGMFLHVTLSFGARDALVVPEAAVMVEGADTFLYVVAGGRAERRSISLGERAPGLVEVTAGVAAGETVAVGGLQRLSDGAAVRVVGGTPGSAPLAGAGAEGAT